MTPDVLAEPGRAGSERAGSERAESGLAESVLADAGEAATRAAKAAGVVVRELGTIEELGAMVALFDEIWAPEDGNSSLRLDMLRAMTKAGNYACGAYDLASGDLLGACTGFFGPPARAELHSHIAGVRPAGRRRAVGFALKVHQRAWCLRRDVRVIAWTYDPLIRRNSYFNLVKLGARPAEYLRNFYGTMDDAINGGTETDRLLVHWDLSADLVADASCGPTAAGLVRGRARERRGDRPVGGTGRAARPRLARWRTIGRRPGGRPVVSRRPGGRRRVRRPQAACRRPRRHRGDARVRPRECGGVARRAPRRAVAAAEQRCAGNRFRQERLVRGFS